MVETPAVTEGSSASDASQPAASSAETPSTGVETVAASTPSSDGDASAALASKFGVVDDAPGPSRDERGRFAPKQGEAAPAPDAPGAAVASATPAPEKFKLGDIEFDSPDHAAQQFKSLRGMFKPLESKVRDTQNELTRAINVASAWEAVARKHGYTDDGSKPATAAPAAAPASAAPDAPAEPNWDILAHLANHPETGTVGALIQYHQEVQRLAEAREQKLRDEIRQEIEGKYAPVLADRAEQAELAEVGALVDTMAEWTVTATGQPFFPELSDGQKLKEIGELWRSAGHDNAQLKTQQGLTAAIALYRMWNGVASAASAPAPSTPAPPAPVAPAPPGSSDLALAMGGSAPPNVRPSGPASPQQAARAAIRSADVMDARWGVSP
jgi:hypothetical protein